MGEGKGVRLRAAGDLGSWENRRGVTLQPFPDSLTLGGSKTSQVEQVGPQGGLALGIRGASCPSFPDSPGVTCLQGLSLLGTPTLPGSVLPQERARCLQRPRLSFLQWVESALGLGSRDEEDIN